MNLGNNQASKRPPTAGGRSSTGGTSSKPPDDDDASEGSNDPLNNLFGGSSRPAPKGPKAKPVRFGSNRDWVIPVECTADAIALPTTGRRFALSELQGQPSNDNPLLRLVKGMIDRKQASVRAGEGDWHPQIRFIVRPDGFRSYYLAYPALEALRLPMVREVTEKEPEEGRP